VPFFLGGGFGGGLALGLGLTLFLEMQDTSMRSERDVELALRLPVLVTIPVIQYHAKATKAPTTILKPSASGGATA